MTPAAISAAADLEAAARYRALAGRNPSLRRDYLKRADLCEAIARVKVVGESATFAEAVEKGRADYMRVTGQTE